MRGSLSSCTVCGLQIVFVPCTVNCFPPKTSFLRWRLQTSRSYSRSSLHHASYRNSLVHSGSWVMTFKGYEILQFLHVPFLLFRDIWDTALVTNLNFYKMASVWVLFQSVLLCVKIGSISTKSEGFFKSEILFGCSLGFVSFDEVKCKLPQPSLQCNGKIWCFQPCTELVVERTSIYSLFHDILVLQNKDKFQP